MFPTAFRDLAKPQVLGIIGAVKTANGITIPKLAEELNLSYMGVKKHCVKLEDQGYIKSWRIPREGVGRPQKLYTLTAKCDELFPDTGIEVVINVLEGVKEFFGESSPEKLFFHHYEKQREQWAKSISKGSSLVEKATRLADLRAKSGCFSRCKYDNEHGFRIEEYHHPMKQLFKLYPNLIKLEVRMMEQLLGSAVSRKELSLSKGGNLVIYQIGTLA